jgi:polysaccharide export outer membrane protein
MGMETEMTPQFDLATMRTLALRFFIGLGITLPLAINVIAQQDHSQITSRTCNGCGVTHAPEACLGGCQPVIQGVDCAWNCGAEGRWADARPIDFQPYAQGEYAGPARLAHLRVYRIRPNDQIQLLYIVNRRQIDGDYELMIGDSVMIDSVSNVDLNAGTLALGLVIQPDGSLFPKLIGKVHAAGLTVTELRELLEIKYKPLYNKPAIDVTPVKTNTLAEDIRNAVGGASGFTQQSLNVRVTPDGKIRLPWIGEICVQGMTLDEIKREINLRYGEAEAGLVVEPILQLQAPHFVFVTGEVNQPGQIELAGPTTISGAIAAAGGWQGAANLRNIVVLRRAEDWRLVATVLDIRGASLGRRPTPTDEIWLRDGDVIIVPPTPVAVTNEWIRQVFTEGIYGVVPFGGISFQFDSN